MLVLMGACAPPRGSAPHPPIPRTVRVDGGIVVLGEPLPSNLKRSPDGDSLIALRPEAGSAVARVIVRVDSGQRVIAITSDYQHLVSYDSLRAGYEKTFGPPERSRLVRRGEEPAETSIWRDAQSEMRLVHDPNRNAWTVRLILQGHATGH